MGQHGGRDQRPPGVTQYSAGVAAMPGFRLERVRFARPVPLRRGFQRIAAILAAADRPHAAFCACELRSPAPFTEEGFRAFNEIYIGTLADWGIMSGDDNPVARSNVCPEIAPPAENWAPNGEQSLTLNRRISSMVVITKENRRDDIHARGVDMPPKFR